MDEKTTYTQTHLTKEEIKTYQRLKSNIFLLETNFEMNCTDGNLLHIKYILENKLLTDSDTIKNGLYQACEFGQINIIEYILNKKEEFFNSKKILEEVYYHCLKTSDLHKQLHVINYLVFEHQIQLHPPLFSKLQLILEEKPYIAELFEKRILNENLNNSLMKKTCQQSVRNKI